MALTAPPTAVGSLTPQLWDQSATGVVVVCTGHA
mgnify:CR=1 FL=1